jgi:hypothetical protein
MNFQLFVIQLISLTINCLYMCKFAIAILFFMMNERKTSFLKSRKDRKAGKVAFCGFSAFIPNSFQHCLSLFYMNFTKTNICYAL